MNKRTWWQECQKRIERELYAQNIEQKRSSHSRTGKWWHALYRKRHSKVACE